MFAGASVIPVLLLTTPVLSFFLNFGTDFATRTNSILDAPLIDDPRLQARSDLPLWTCPPSPKRIPPLNSTCAYDGECQPRGAREHLCCPFGRYRFCLPAIPRQSEVVRHKPFLGVPRHCPTLTEPLQEFLPVQNCTRDVECEPRICCPDGRVSYCRTAVPRLEPRSSHAVRAIRNFVSYLQCSPPPPPFLDLFPKACKYSFDCFPNICCQEKGKKICRPAKRSILRLLASFT